MMFDKELMKQLATIPTQNRKEWFAERDKLETLAVEMTRINAKDMVQKYGIARVLRVLAATIKQNPKDYMRMWWKWPDGCRPSGRVGMRRCGSAQPSTGHTSKTCFASMRTCASCEKGA